MFVLLLAASVFGEKLYKEFNELTAEELRSLPPIVFERVSARHRAQQNREIVGGVEVSPKYKYEFMVDLYYTLGE